MTQTMRAVENELIACRPDWRQADFRHRAAQIALQFQSENIQTVGLWLADAAQFACVLLACFHAKVKILLPPNELPENRRWVTEQAGLWFDDGLFAEFGILQKVSEKQPLVSLEDDTEMWLKTSGSSGEAKILKKTAAQLWAEAEAVAKTLPFDVQECQLIGSVSVQHFYGLTFRVLLPLWQRANGLNWQIGRRQLLYPEYIFRAARHSVPSILISSPALLGRLNLERSDFEQCRIVGAVSSGGILHDEVGLTVQTKLNRPLVEIYGSTETGAMAYRRPAQLWRPLPDIRCGQDENGALWVESPRIKAREQTADIVVLREAGFELLGRADRIVKLGDKRVSLAKIEQDLQRHEFVSDAYVARHPQKQRAAAWVALSRAGIEYWRENGRKATIDLLKPFLAKTQETSALPRYWRFTDQLPRNAQSKILRADFERACLQKELTPLWHAGESGSEKELVLKGIVPIDLYYFRGHFANFPLVPGVVELQWAAERIPAWLGRTFEIERTDNLKFRQFLRPNDRVELRLERDEAKKRVKFTLKSNDEICTSGLFIEKICNNENGETAE